MYIYYLGRSFSSHEIEDRLFFCFPSQCMVDWEAREVASPKICWLKFCSYHNKSVKKQLTRSRPKRAHVF